MEADIGPGTICSELAVDHPRTQLLVDVASHGLVNVSDGYAKGHHEDDLITSSSSLLKVGGRTQVSMSWAQTSAIIRRALSD